MKLVDANVLLYAVNSSDPKHPTAKAWLDGCLNGTQTVAFSWTVLLAFLRLSTKVGLFPQPLSIDGSVARIGAWLEHSGSVVIEPTPRHLDVLAGLLTEIGAGGNIVNDAHLAALAVEHDATVVSFDTDFARFTGVRYEPPA